MAVSMMALVLVAEALLALFVGGAGGVMFAFARNASPPPSAWGSALQVAALLVSLTPLGLVGWVAWRRFFNTPAWPRVPLGIWLPFVAGPGCLFLAWGTFFLAEAVGRS